MASTEQDAANTPPVTNEDEVVIPADANNHPDGAINKVPEEVVEGQVFNPRKHITEQQTAILDEFKERVGKYEMSDKEKGYFMDDMCLLRYLRARDYNIDKAYKMIIDSIEWRRTHNPDSIKLSEIEPIARTGCVYVHGKDKMGRPLIYARPYRDDLIQGSVDTATKFKHLVYWVEKGFSMMDKSKGVEGFTLITDYKNFGRRHMDTKTNMEVLHYLNNHCPERMGKTFFLDPPFLFWVGWKIISPFLSQATLNKVSFIKSSSTKGDQRFFPEMLEFIDEDVLEYEFGGKNTYKYNYDEYAKVEG